MAVIPRGRAKVQDQCDHRINVVRILMQELRTVRLSIIANLPHRHELFGCRLMFKAKQRNRCLAAFQQLGHISFLLMNPSVGFVLAPILHRFQIICHYDLFPIKEQNVHDISEYIIIICQQFLGNIFLCHGSLNFLSGPRHAPILYQNRAPQRKHFHSSQHSHCRKDHL